MRYAACTNRSRILSAIAGPVMRSLANARRAVCVEYPREREQLAIHKAVRGNFKRTATKTTTVGQKATPNHLFIKSLRPRSYFTKRTINHAGGRSGRWQCISSALPEDEGRQQGEERSNATSAASLHPGSGQRSLGALNPLSFSTRAAMLGSHWRGLAKAECQQASTRSLNLWMQSSIPPGSAGVVFPK